MTNAANGAQPTYLAPDWRFAGDDWEGANALTYIVYATAPVYASDGVTITTPGVPQSLAGYSVRGTLRYQARCAFGPVPQPSLAPLATPVGAVLDPVNGIISLSVPSASTVFPRQSLALWSNPGAALLIVQPQIVDPSGNVVTVGLQQLFVF